MGEFTFKNVTQDGNMALVGAQIAWMIENCYAVSIDANDERGYFQSVGETMLNNIYDDAFESAEDRALCIEKNHIVTVQVYTRGSVGFYFVAGSDLARTVQRAYDAAKEELDPRPNPWRAGT